MALDWSNEEYTGSDASGTNGQANRILTLANSGLTNNNGFLIKVGGIYLKRGSEFTLTHADSGSTITFLNGLWDDMAIEVKYYVRTWGDPLRNWKTQNSSGSDCSGSSGDSNRVLTLANTDSTTNGGLFASVSGVKLFIGDEYTVVHGRTSSKITFLNPLWDDMTLVIKYYEKPDRSTKAYSKVRDDFQEIVLEHGVNAYLKRPTETVDSMGGVSAVELAEYQIFASIQDITNKDRQIISMGLANPGSAKCFFFHEYPNSVTSNGDLTVQTGDIIVDEFDKEWRLEQILGKKRFQGEIIFISSVIKRIDLD